jgi:uncharacterized protein
MSELLPELVDPLSLAEKGRVLQGQLEFSSLDRLQDEANSGEGQILVRLAFEKQGGRATVAVSVRGDLTLQCQCCLKPLAYHVEREAVLGIVRSLEEADRLPEAFEPLLLEEEVISPVDLAQDEILLALPLIPRHESCVMESYAQPAEIPDPEPVANPFAILSQLKKS